MYGTVLYWVPRLASMERGGEVGESPMDAFIHDQNLKNWRSQLSKTEDAALRSVLLSLIAEEEARGAEIEMKSKDRLPPMGDE